MQDQGRRRYRITAALRIAKDSHSLLRVSVIGDSIEHAFKKAKRVMAPLHDYHIVTMQGCPRPMQVSVHGGAK